MGFTWWRPAREFMLDRVSESSRRSLVQTTWQAMVLHTSSMAFFCRQPSSAIRSRTLLSWLSLWMISPLWWRQLSQEILSKHSALPEGTLDTLLKPENKDQLVDILTYHVLPAQVL